MKICTCCLIGYIAVIIWIRSEIFIIVCVQVIVFRVVILVYVVLYVDPVFPFLGL